MRADYHIHTEFSDDSDYAMEKVIQDAIAKVVPVNQRKCHWQTFIIRLITKHLKKCGRCMMIRLN